MNSITTSRGKRRAGHVDERREIHTEQVGEGNPRERDHL
jgi:hypothetical protein